MQTMMQYTLQILVRLYQFVILLNISSLLLHALLANILNCLCCQRYTTRKFQGPSCRRDALR